MAHAALGLVDFAPVLEVNNSLAKPVIVERSVDEANRRGDCDGISEAGPSAEQAVALFSGVADVAGAPGAVQAWLEGRFAAAPTAPLARAIRAA